MLGCLNHEGENSGGWEAEPTSTHLCRVRKHFRHCCGTLWEEGGCERWVTMAGSHKLSWTTTPALPWSSALSPTPQNGLSSAPQKSVLPLQLSDRGEQTSINLSAFICKMGTRMVSTQRADSDIKHKGYTLYISCTVPMINGFGCFHCK